MLWTHAVAVVPPFTGSAVVDVPAPCSYDFGVAAVRYFDALEGGDVPLCFLFSGTVFYEAGDGALRAAPVPWEKEATYRLPVAAWKELMELYYPNCAWVVLRKDVFDRLGRYKSGRGLATWEQALEKLLAAAEIPPPLSPRSGGRGAGVRGSALWLRKHPSPPAPSPLYSGERGESELRNEPGACGPYRERRPV